MSAKNSKDENKSFGDCFVIMPLSDPDGYEIGHFRRVYEDIFKPACAASGFNPIRGDNIKQTNLIHLDILQRLIESPMAICDLSARNPNVLFELGLRQAFDKPTVLVQEVGTQPIFDIAPLRYTLYRRGLKYREVLEDQISLSEAIDATRESTSKGEGINSIVRILSLSHPATLKQVEQADSSGVLQIIRAEMSELRSDLRRAMAGAAVDANAVGNSSAYEYSKAISIARVRLAQVEIALSEGASNRFIVDLINNAVSDLTGVERELYRKMGDAGGLPVSLILERQEVLNSFHAIEKRLVGQSDA